MSNIIICDCEKAEVESLQDGLNTANTTFEIKSHVANWKRTGKLSELRRYGKYFLVAFYYFIQRNKYDVIIGWQQFYALIYGFFCSVFHTKKTSKVIVLNFTYKEKTGKVAKIYRWFMKRCLDPQYVDYLHVPSQGYAEKISKDFHFPLDRMIVVPFGINDPYEKYSKLPYPSTAPCEGYVLSIGRSNRDYDFLISAWKGIQFPLVIISDTYEGNNRDNPYVIIIRNIAGEESYPWISHCSAMIIPIDDGSICSGDTVLLTSMAMKKKILITIPSTLAEMYISHEVNGLFVEKNEQLFKELVSNMLFTENFEYLKDSARESYLQNYSRTSMGKRLNEIIL